MTRERAWKLLLVEDDADSAEALVALFELPGIEALWAIDGPSALQALDSIERLDLRPPDFVLLDVNLPRTDTVELGLELRRHLAGSPVVLVSATSLPVLEHTAAEIGAVGVVRKPFKMEQLFAILDEHAPGEGAVNERSGGRR